LEVPHLSSNFSFFYLRRRLLYLLKNYFDLLQHITNVRVTRAREEERRAEERGTSGQIGGTAPLPQKKILATGDCSKSTKILKPVPAFFPIFIYHLLSFVSSPPFPLSEPRDLGEPSYFWRKTSHNITKDNTNSSSSSNTRTIYSAIVYSEAICESSLGSSRSAPGG